MRSSEARACRALLSAMLVSLLGAGGCAADAEEPVEDAASAQNGIETPEDLAARLKALVDAGTHNCQAVHAEWRKYASLASVAMPVASRFLLDYLDGRGDQFYGYSTGAPLTETRIWDGLRFDAAQRDARAYLDGVAGDAIRSVDGLPTRGEWTRVEYTDRSPSVCRRSGDGCLLDTLMGGRYTHVPGIGAVTIRPDLGYAFGTFTMTPRVYVRKASALFRTTYEIAVQHDYYDFYDWTDAYETDRQMLWLDEACGMASTYHIRGTSAPYATVATFTCEGSTCTLTSPPTWSWVGMLR